MEKHGIPLNYGSIHTKEIKYSLKHEKTQRKKEEPLSNYLTNTTEDLPEHTSYLSLYTDAPRISRRRDKTPIKINENEEKTKRSSSKLRSMKDKVKKTLKRTTNNPNHLTVNRQQVEMSSDTSDNE